MIFHKVFATPDRRIQTASSAASFDHIKQTLLRPGIIIRVFYLMIRGIIDIIDLLFPGFHGFEKSAVGQCLLQDFFTKLRLNVCFCMIEVLVFLL